MRIKDAALIIAKELDAISLELKAVARCSEDTAAALWHEKAVNTLKSVTARAENFEDSYPCSIDAFTGLLKPRKKVVDDLESFEEGVWQ